MWAFAYIVTALVAPWVGGLDIGINIILFAGLGAWMLLSLGLYSHKDKILPYDTIPKSLGRAFLFILALIEVFGGITSWCGIGVWNVPFPNKELFAVSMAFADLLSAVFMFYLAIDK